MLDQGAQSLVNLVVGVVAARALSASDFGAFSIAFLLFTVAWGSYRALLVEPAIVLFREAPVTQVLDAKAGMIVLSLMLTAPLCAVGWISGSMQQEPIASALKAFSTILPCIIFLDVIRGIFHAARQPISAAIVSATWLCIVLVLYIAIDVTDSEGIYLLVLPFGIIAGLLAIYSIRSSYQNILAHIRQMQVKVVLKIGWPLFLDFLLVGITIHLMGLLLGFFYGLEQAGAFRGATIIVGPLVTLIAGARLASLSDATRYRAASGDNQWKAYLIRVTSIGMPICVFLGLLLLWFSDNYGTKILGETWAAAQSVVLPMTLFIIATFVHLVTGAVLRARELAVLSLMTRFKQLPIVIGCSWIGMYNGEASGAAWGLFVGNLLSIPFWVHAALSNQVTSTQNSNTI